MAEVITDYGTTEVMFAGNMPVFGAAALVEAAQTDRSEEALDLTGVHKAGEMALELANLTYPNN